jgi:RNA polymerase sigma-70 factor (ECF subfamily)
MAVAIRALQPMFTSRTALRAMDDARVARAHLAGEPLAFDVLVERYHSRLVNFLYRTIGDRERAEDLTQEAFVRVHRHLARFDQSKKFSTWLYTIASNLGKNELRNRARNPLVYFQSLGNSWEDDDRPVEFEDERARPDDAFAQRQLQAEVAQTVAQLPRHHREVFVMRELEGKSYEEIAELTRCNLGTVKSRLNRARTSFAEIIGPRRD